MRRAKAKLTVSTFPFLAVLLCAMGSLIMLLMVFDQRAKRAARQRNIQQAVEVTQREEERWKKAQAMVAEQDAEAETEREKLLQQMRLESEQRLRELGEEASKLSASERQALQARAAEEEGIIALKRQTAEAARDREKSQSELAAMRASLDKAQRDRVEREKQRRELQDAVENSKKAVEVERQAEKARLDRLSIELGDLEKVIKQAEEKKEKSAQTFSIIPYKGKRGEDKRPIYVECTWNKLIFHPDKVVVDPGDPRMGLLLQIEDRARAQNKLYETAGLPPHPRPFLMLLVRPDGIATYYQFQVAVKGQGIDFGYELIDQDWELEFPQDAPAPAKEPPKLAQAQPNLPTNTPLRLPREMGGTLTGQVGNPTLVGPAGESGALGLPGLPGVGGAGVGLGNSGSGSGLGGGLPRGFRSGGEAGIGREGGLGGIANGPAGIPGNGSGMGNGLAGSLGDGPGGIGSSGLGFGTGARGAGGLGGGGQNEGSPGRGMAGGNGKSVASGGPDGMGGNPGDMGRNGATAGKNNGIGGLAGRPGAGGNGLEQGLGGNGELALGIPGLPNEGGPVGLDGGIPGTTPSPQRIPGPTAPALGATGLAKQGGFGGLPGALPGVEGGSAGGAGMGSVAGAGGLGANTGGGGGAVGGSLGSIGGGAGIGTAAGTRGAGPSEGTGSPAGTNVGGASGETSVSSNSGTTSTGSASASPANGGGALGALQPIDGPPPAPGLNIGSSGSPGSSGGGGMSINLNPREKNEEQPPPAKSPRPSGGASDGFPGSDDPAMEALNRLAVPLPSVEEDRPKVPRPLKMARLTGGRELTHFVECTADGVILHPGGKKFSRQSISQGGDNNPLFQELKEKVERRKVLDKAAGTTSFIEVRFLVWPDGMRAYHALYPTISTWNVHSQQQTIKNAKDLRDALSGR